MVDSSPSPRPSRANFFGPLRNLLSVRSGGWLKRFEDCMLEVAATQDLEETLYDMEVCIGELVSVKDFDSMVATTFEFGESIIMAEDITDMIRAGFFKEGRAMAPPAGQMVPASKAEYEVVFRDYFTSGLWMLPHAFHRQVMEAFNVELHHFSPNGILMLSKFS